MSRQEGKVFIGGLSWETTDDKLKRYFENYGTVQEAFVSYDRATGRPRGFGFVVFADPVIADKVVAQQHTIDRREVEAKKALPKDESPVSKDQQASSLGQRTKKIFVGGLAPTVDEDTFRAYFADFGQVDDAVVMYDHENKRPRGFGFITFTEEEAVDQVFARGSIQTIHDKQIEIKRAVPRDSMPAGHQIQQHQRGGGGPPGHIYNNNRGGYPPQQYHPHHGDLRPHRMYNDRHQHYYGGPPLRGGGYGGHRGGGYGGYGGGGGGRGSGLHSAPPQYNTNAPPPAIVTGIPANMQGGPSPSEAAAAAAAGSAGPGAGASSSSMGLQVGGMGMSAPPQPGAMPLGHHPGNALVGGYPGLPNGIPASQVGGPGGGGASSGTGGGTGGGPGGGYQLDAAAAAAAAAHAQQAAAQNLAELQHQVVMGGGMNGGLHEQIQQQHQAQQAQQQAQQTQHAQAAIWG